MKYLLALAHVIWITVPRKIVKDVFFFVLAILSLPLLWFAPIKVCEYIFYTPCRLFGHHRDHIGYCLDCYTSLQSLPPARIVK